MGRIYDQLKQNIDFLNEVDRRLQNNELLNMHEIWEVQKAVVNINYVINYVEQSLEDAVEEGRLENGNNQSFNIPEDFEIMVDQWEQQFEKEQIDNVVDHLKSNQRVPSYSPEINEPDPIRYYEYVTGTLDNIVPSVTRGHLDQPQKHLQASLIQRDKIMLIQRLNKTLSWIQRWGKLHKTSIHG